MGLISELSEKTTLDGSEQIPVWNADPSSQFPDDNYRIALSRVAAYLGSALQVIAATVSERQTDIIDGESSYDGDIVYLRNAKILAKRVTLGSGSSTSTKYYTTFVDDLCNSGEPEARKIYTIPVSVGAPTLLMWNGSDLVDIFDEVRPTVMTQDDFDALGEITDNKIRYIIEEE